MAVKTGPGAQRQTAVAKSVSDLGALMSAKAEANMQPQPDIQVQAEVSVLPESTTNLTGVASVTKEADIQSTPATAQSEQTTKEETMSKNETTQAQAVATQVPAADQAPATTAAQVATAAAPATAPAAVPTPAATAAATPADATAAPAAESTTPPTPTWAMLETLEKGLGVENLDTLDSLRSSLGARAERFKTLVAITKDTVGRVDALEAQIAELKKNGTTKTTTLTIKSPDWKDQIVEGLLMGSATAVGVFGIAYAFDAMFGQPRAAESSEPAIQ